MPNGNGSITGGQTTVASTKSWKTSYMMGVIVGVFASATVAIAVAMAVSAG